jgi:hypothetical protein
METKTIVIEKFRDNNGQPTCARIWGRENCSMLRVGGMCGKQEICGYVCDNLTRRDGDGTIEPHQECPVWNGD